MQLITDINTFFRKDQSYGIKKLLWTISNFSNGWNKTFKLSRTYNVWLSENNQRKVLKLLSDYGLLERHLVYWELVVNEKTWKACKKTIYIYKVTNKLYKQLRKYITKIVNNIKYTELKANNTIIEVKNILKNIYKNITFTKNKFWAYIWVLKWVRIALFKNKDWLVNIKYNWEITEWVMFYMLNIKKNG